MKNVAIIGMLLLCLWVGTKGWGQTTGPDAPTVDWIELDQELIAVFTNDTTGLSNNAFERYAEKGVTIPEGVRDSLYRFEGYRLFQFSGPDVTLADRDDPTKVREVFQVDLQNEVGTIFNWDTVRSENGPVPPIPRLYVFKLMVEGQNQGIRHTFRITEDVFAEGDRRLINHKRYYFAAVAYAYNEYVPFVPFTGEGQIKPYLEGDGNIGDGEHPYYMVSPRPVVDQNLNAKYESVEITRLDGIGNGGNFLDLTQECRDQIEATIRNNTTFEGTLAYKAGKAPIDVKIYNPLEVKDGAYELTFVDENKADNTLDESARWELRNLSAPGAPVILSDLTIERLNEQIIREYGFSVAIGQVAEVGAKLDPTNGVVGYEEEYAGGAEAEPWIRGIPDGFRPLGDSIFWEPKILDYVVNGPGEADESHDPTQAFTHIGPGTFVPYFMANWRSHDFGYYSSYSITPAWSSIDNSIVRLPSSLATLNNVDIVFTSDKDLWSRCVIVEKMNLNYEDYGYFAKGERNDFDLRSDPNVTKFDHDGDGLPDIDTNDPGIGMGWFPGYAVDVETGQRLNIFFGENSVFDCGNLVSLDICTSEVECNQMIGDDTGGDMMFNPTSYLTIADTSHPDYILTFLNYILGGQHFVYVANSPYDRCAFFADRFDPYLGPLRKVAALRQLTWAGLIMTQPGTEMLSYADGLIPEDVRIKLRVDNPFQVEVGTGDFNGYPTYRFRIEGKQVTELASNEVDHALDQIQIAPNPFNGSSGSARIINLPARCVVTIYTLDGKLIRQYQRNERPGPSYGYGISESQISSALELDIPSVNGSPLASGVYIIHVKAGGLGERTLKWVVVN